MVTSPMPAPRAAAEVHVDWDRLSARTVDPDLFDLDMLDGLPEPARRWVRHSVPVGAPLARSVQLQMRGQIRLGEWRPFTAVQVLAPPHGFIWAATARVLGLPVSGFDRWSSGSGQMRWRLLGAVPVMSARGADVTLSAAGRLAGEGVLAPTTFRRAAWSTGGGNDRAIAAWRIGAAQESAELQIGPSGQLLSVAVQRWGNPAGTGYARYPFGVTVTDEATFAGITIPSALRAGWWWGTDRHEEGEFFRAQITGAAFR